MKKSFDCVQMKWDIQQKLIEEYKDLSVEERKALMEKKISADPVLGPWMDKLYQKSREHAKVAEQREEYGKN